MSYEPYAINDKVYKSLIKLCVDICKRNGIKKLMWKADKSLIGQVDKQNMTVHRWFNSGKSCPGEYIYSRLGKIANEVNAQLGVKSSTTAASKKSNTEIAKDVIRGSWGNGVERKRRLTAAGYNYTAVQAEVDRMLGKKTSTVSKPAKISKGDRVKIKQGATWYGGTKVLTGWLLKKTWIVDEIVGNRAVLGKDTTGVFNIQSPIDVKYLKK